MDFIEGLPTSATYNCIMVVVDKFSKYSHFIRLAHPFSALKIAKLYMEHVYKLHGIPQAIVSDRDKIFTSQLWQELFKLSGTDLRMSSAYHPQSDGQTERVNQSVEAYLRCFIQNCPTKWSDWLALAEFWYNTNLHSALNKSPFEVLYGHPPRHFGIEGVDACAVPDLATWLRDHQDMINLLQQLLRAQQRMKYQADKSRSERSFAVGEQVWLKLQPYVQTSVAHRASNKLSFRYFGPFEILSKIGSVAYKLKLPADSSIHPVFHVSLLKKAVGTPSHPIMPFPSDVQSVQVPELVLDRRLRTKNNCVISQLLIKWSHLPPELATLEDEDSIQPQLPTATACGQAMFQGREDVTKSPGRLHADDQGQEIRHGTRVRKPNTFISLYPGYKPYIVEEEFVVEQELCDSIQ